jgi:putative transcriptional regulator
MEPAPSDPTNHPSGAHQSLAGKLLVTPPWVDDPNFTRAVVFVLVHNPEGAVGLVINDATPFRLHDSTQPTTQYLATHYPTFPEWHHLIAPPETVFLGGPCDPLTMLALGRIAEPRTPDAVGVVDLSASPQTPITEVRCFFGYSGWAPGQLDAELSRDGWYVVEATPDDVFTDSAATLWETVLRRSGPELAYVSRVPSDPTLN